MFSGLSHYARWLVFVWFALLFLAAAWFYSWAPSTYPVQWTSKKGDGLYAELTDAYLHGHLHLARSPAAGLLALDDPYDPAKNAPYRVNDLSYYRGHYYLYHGSAPVLTLLAPFRLLTGSYLTDPAAALIFCLVGAIFSLLLLGDIWRESVPQASRTVMVVCSFAVLFCHGYYLVLRNAGINQVAIASAYCFLCLAIWSGFRALFTSQRAWPWLLLAACAYGLAIASRPNYIFGALALFIPPLVLRRRSVPGWSWLNFAAVAAPLFAIVGGILVHNYLRFGQPLEFGQRYMLGAWDQRTLGFFGIKYLPSNAWNYLISPGLLSLDFPFLTAPSWQAVGILVQAPIVWLSGSVAVFWLWKSEPRPARPLRSLAGMLALIFACNLGQLLLLPSGNDQAVLTSANARYTFDFLPVLVLLTCIGLLSVDHRLAGHPWLGRLWRSIALGLGLLSVLGAVSLDFQRFPPECYRPLAQALNWPTHLAQRWLGTIYGAVELEVNFPPGKTGSYEPLVATGTPDAGDLLYVFYDSPTTVRFSLVGTAMQGPVSPPIPVSYGKPHRLAISMGSLYPPGGNPLLSSLDEAAVAHLKRTLRIELDGRVVFEVPAHFFPSESRQVQLGSTNLLLAYSGPKFSGRILSNRRLPITPLAAERDSNPDYGTIRMVLRFPENKTGVAEPLVVSGLQNAGDFVYVRYESNWQISVGLDHWGHMGLRSAWLPIDYSVNHVVEIQMGALFPPVGHVLLSALSPAVREHLKEHVRIMLDGEVVLDADQPTFDSSPYDVFIGRNAIGGSTCVYEFSGQIKAISRLPLPTTSK